VLDDATAHRLALAGVAALPTAPSMPDRRTVAPTSGGAMLVFGGRL
jgi:hypothetical protein